MNERIWTIGHSTQEFEDVLAMLRAYGVVCLVDVPSYPSSKKFPQWNMAAIVAALDGKAAAARLLDRMPDSSADLNVSGVGQGRDLILGTERRQCAEQCFGLAGAGGVVFAARPDAVMALAEIAGFCSL